MKVLIADDDAVSRTLLQRYLEKWGYEVTAADGGQEAWGLYQQNPYPVVISDWMMPDLDGPELVRRIRSGQWQIYTFIILLSARSEKEDVVTGMEAGADDFITKPFDQEELRVRIRAGERVVTLERSLAEQNRMLRETQAALVQSEKMASLGRLASGMAHEINNPITSVLNNLAVLHRDTEGVLAILDVYRQGITALEQCAPELACEARRLEKEKDLAFFYNNLGKITDGMRKGLMRIRNIVHNLADFAHLDEAERKEVDINAALASVAQILQHDLSAKDLRLDADFQPLPMLWGQPSKLNQVFLNLLVNAIQACEPQGTISLRTRAEDGWVIVEIEDNGVGIAVADLPHIFEPFFTTKPVGEGTGLGLAVSYGIVRDHGGLIAASSEPGKGSTFCVRLPVAGSRPNEKHS